ncbi:hypothetical protein E2R62_09805 [Citrobacter rodentium]|uniref:Copper resistance protein n=1 Tax=Citrobacter rodentium TaxID=67825 RepID=A0A482PNU3_CITRO|nr:hypothetical protein E2R62_09805 [Citrobacter rodentium]
MSTKNDGHYFCGAGGNRPDGLNETLTQNLLMPGLFKPVGSLLMRLRLVGASQTLEKIFRIWQQLRKRLI